MERKDAFVLSVNISKGGIPKIPVESARVTLHGLEGDGHNHAKHDRLTQGVCLQDSEKLEELSREGYPLKPGTAGENLTVENLAVNRLPVGTRLKFEGGVLLEITRERPTCYVMDQINPNLKEAARGRHGMYAKVLEEGILRAGETIDAVPPEQFLPG
jgi:MOSC domain-containing protein YiiM